jgi:CO dehydrogenase maturation factor
MKVAVTGKGGVGKTTVAAYLARCWRDMGCKVSAVDADPDANLAGTLGYRGEITPLVKLKRLVEERVGGGEGWGGFLKMNPRVDDIPEQFGVDVDGIRVLALGTIERGRRGCACPENILLREVLNHLILRRREHVVVDMEAGIEHLGRGTAEGVDAMLVVVEPGWASLETARRVEALARDLGIARVEIVANKISGAADLEFVRAHAATEPLGVLPLDRELELEARSGRFSPERPFYREMLRMAEWLAGDTDKERA